MDSAVAFEIQGSPTAQSIPSQTSFPGTVITFSGSSPLYDSFAGWDATNHQYAVPEDGYYYVFGEIWTDVGNGNRKSLILLNGSVAIEGQTSYQVQFALMATGLLYLHAGDKIQLSLQQDSGSSENVQWGPTRLGLFYVGT
jgi:hypothetical protein